MNKVLFMMLLSLCMGALALAQDEPTIITQPPAGDTIDLYRTTTGFESVYYYAIADSSSGDWQRMIFGNDGAVYLENPLNTLYTKTWIKGSRADGDTISFQLPQAIYSEDDIFNGGKSYGYLYRIHPVSQDGKDTFRPNEGEDNQVLRYVWRNDSLIMIIPEGEMIGMCKANGAWTSYAEGSYKAVRKANNTIAPSAGAKVWDGLMLYMDMEGKSQLYPVKYAFDGNDVYLGDLSANVKGLWIKGVREGSTVTFPPTSYVGIDTKTACYVYASSAILGKGVDEMGTEFDKPCFSSDPLVFTYDEEKNSLSTKGMLMIHKSIDDDRSTNIFDSYRYALINLWDKRPAAPMPPKLTAYQPYDPSPYGGPGGLQFTLSYYSADFNYLEPSHLYYNLYIDGQLKTFKAEEYKNLETDMTDVPYSFYDQYEFYRYDENNRTIYFYQEAKEKVGMEALYIDGDIRIGSGITEYYINGENPNSISEPSTTSRTTTLVEYYDLSGRRVSTPDKGVYIRKTTYSDGTQEVQKIIL